MSKRILVEHVLFMLLYEFVPLTCGGHDGYSHVEIMMDIPMWRWSQFYK